MAFDDEVDAARRRLENERAAPAVAPPLGEEALAPLLAALRAKIVSRRLAFALVELDDGPVIEVTHVETDEALGQAYIEDSEYVFESAHDDYFDDLVDEDMASFALRLYETLRADLPKYEVEFDDD